MSHHLWNLWRQTLAQRETVVAIIDATTGMRHTFGALQAAVDALPSLPPRSLHAVPVAEGNLNFILQTLRAWRDDAVLCPLEREGARLPDITGLPAEIVHLKMTSGSTGEPRCVMFRAEQLEADAVHIRATMKLNIAWPNLAVISIAHSYGFSNVVLPLLLQGHPLISVPDALPGSLRRGISAGADGHSAPNGFTLPAVPAMWRAWWQSGLLEQAPIECAISAGAPLPLEVERGIFHECGLKIHNFYGSSECGGIAYDRTELPRQDAACAGSAMEGVTLETNADGCLIVRGPNAGAGYWPRPDAALEEGRFITSDLVELREGMVLMRGRMSDAINIAGRKLNPADVEHAALACPGVTHCVVFGIPSADATRCEEAVACVNAIPSVQEQHLIKVLSERLAPWQMPRRFWFCSELQPNVRGKFSRSEWRTKWMNREKSGTHG